MKISSKGLVRSRIGKLAVLFVVALCLLPSASSSAQYSKQQQAELASIAQAALEAQQQILVSGDVEGAVIFSPHARQHIKVTRERAEDTLTTRGFLAEHQQAYSDFNTKLTVKSAAINGSTATLQATEYTILTIANYDNDPLTPSTTEYTQDHLFTFVAENGEWKLAEDYLLNIPGPVIEETAEYGPAPTESTAIDESPAEYPAGDTIQRRAQMSASLNRNAIVDYAYKYWQNYNPAYRKFGNDCTNFVSQAMRAGGWPDVLVSFSSVWWYNYFYQSLSWVNAHDFAVFTNNRPRATVAPRLSDLVPGDVLSVDWDRDGHIDHTAIVTRKDSKTIYLTYHSNNVKDLPFAGFEAKAKAEGHPNPVYYGWQLSISPK